MTLQGFSFPTNGLSITIEYIKTEILLDFNLGVYDFMKDSTSRMLTRIKDIYLYIQAEGTVSSVQIAEEFDSTPRTIQRDLYILASNGLVYSPTRGKWTVTDKKVKHFSK